MAALMKRALASLAGLLPDRIDLHLYGGALLVAYGASLYSKPAGWITFGAVLLFVVYRRPA